MGNGQVSCAEWHHFATTRCEVARERIVQANIPLVHSVARRIQKRHGGQLNVDELVQSGCIGLLSAVDAFDPTRGLAFSSFAVPRIRGAILDEMRKQDPSTRLSRARKRDLANAERTIVARELRAPNSVETAKELGVDLSTVHEWRNHARRGVEISLDRPLREGRNATTLAEMIPSGAAARIERGIQFEEAQRRLSELLIRLPERKRLVLQLYYFEGLQQTRIAEILGVTESRVSQIRTRTLAELRESFGAAADDQPEVVPGSADRAVGQAGEAA